MFVNRWCSERADRSSGISRFPMVFAMVTSLILSSRFFHLSLNADETSQVEPATKRAPIDLTDDVVLSTVSQGDWLVVETANFRVWSRLNSEDSIACARRSETLRHELLKKWLPEHSAFKWTPKAEVVIHRTVDEFREALGSQSSGASGGVTVRQEAGRIVRRRVDLRADAADWNTSSLAHELTHLIIADHFSGRQIPRWADEGISLVVRSVESHSKCNKMETKHGDCM